LIEIRTKIAKELKEEFKKGTGKDCVANPTME